MRFLRPVDTPLTRDTWRIENYAYFPKVIFETEWWPSLRSWSLLRIVRPIYALIQHSRYCGINCPNASGKATGGMTDNKSGGPPHHSRLRLKRSEEIREAVTILESYATGEY